MSSLMQKNVGNVDRIARLLLGVAVLSLATAGGTASWIN